MEVEPVAARYARSEGRIPNSGARLTDRQNSSGFSASTRRKALAVDDNTMRV